MTDIEKIKTFIAERLEIASKATLGPWPTYACVSVADENTFRFHAHGPSYLANQGTEIPEKVKFDAAFICDARMRVEKLSRALLTLVEALDRYSYPEGNYSGYTSPEDAFAAVAKEIES